MDHCLYLVKYSPDVLKKKTKVLDISINIGKKNVVNLGNYDGKMREPDVGQNAVDVRVLEEEGDHVVLVVQLALLHLALRSTE